MNGYGHEIKSNRNILMKQKTSQDMKGQMTANTRPNKQTKSKYTELKTNQSGLKVS